MRHGLDVIKNYQHFKGSTCIRQHARNTPVYDIQYRQCRVREIVQTPERVLAHSAAEKCVPDIEKN